MTELITTTKQNLEAVVSSTGATPLNDQVINRTTDKLRSDTSIFLDKDSGASSDAVIHSLLPPSIAVLKISATTHIDSLDAVVELVGALLARKSFDEVCALIPLDDLLEALATSAVPSLQVVAAQQVAKATGDDLAKHKDILETLVAQVTNTETKKSETLEKSVVELATKADSKAVAKKQLVSDNVYASLKKVCSSESKSNAVLIARVLDILEKVLVQEPDDDDSDVPLRLVSLLKFPLSPTFDPEKWDVLLTSAVFMSYGKIFKGVGKLRSPRKLSALLLDTETGIAAELKAISKLYVYRDDEPNILKLLFPDMAILFGVLSGSPDEETVLFFRNEMDKPIGIVQWGLENLDDRAMSLAVIHPEYLLKYYPEGIDSLEYNERDSGGMSNLVSNEKTLAYMKLSETKFLRMADYEIRIYTILSFLDTDLGTRMLVEEWPRVMKEIVNPDPPVTDPDTASFRRWVIERFLDKPTEQLGRWHGPLKEAYREIVFGPGGGSNPQVAIASKSG